MLQAETNREFQLQMKPPLEFQLANAIKIELFKKLLHLAEAHQVAAHSQSQGWQKASCIGLAKLNHRITRLLFAGKKPIQLEGFRHIAN